MMIRWSWFKSCSIGACVEDASKTTSRRSSLKRGPKRLLYRDPVNITSQFQSTCTRPKSISSTVISLTIIQTWGSRWALKCTLRLPSTGFRTSTVPLLIQVSPQKLASSTNLRAAKVLHQMMAVALTKLSQNLTFTSTTLGPPSTALSIVRF